MFVFKGKELVFARKDEGTGDHAPLDDILDICCKVPAAWYAYKLYLWLEANQVRLYIYKLPIDICNYM